MAYLTDRGTQVSQAPETKDAMGPKSLLAYQDAARKAQKEQIKLEQEHLKTQKQELDAQAAMDKVSQLSSQGDVTTSQQMNPAVPVPAEAAVQTPPQPEIPDIYRGDTQYDDPLMQMIADSMKPDPRQAELESELRKTFEGAQANQQSEINRLKALQKDLSQPSEQKDLYPFLNWVDSVAGTNLAQGYQRPKSKEEAMQQDAVLQKEIVKLQGDMTGDQLNFIKSQMQKRADKHQADLLFKLKQSEMTQGRHQDRLLQKESTEISKKMEKLNKEATEEQRVINNLEGMITPDPVTGMVDFQSLQIALSNFARIIGGERGVLTDRDVARIVPANIAQDTAKIKAYFSNIPTADITPEFVSGLKKAIARARENAKAKYETDSNILKTSGINSRFSKDLWAPGQQADLLHRHFNDMIKKGFTGDSQEEAPATPPAPGAAPSGAPMSFEQFIGGQ